MGDPDQGAGGEAEPAVVRPSEAPEEPSDASGAFEVPIGVPVDEEEYLRLKRAAAVPDEDDESGQGDTGENDDR